MLKLYWSRLLYKLTKLTIFSWVLYIILSYNLIKVNNDQNFDFLINSTSPYANTTKVNFQKVSTVNLLIAHPDDEVMFFAPTLLNLNDYFSSLSKSIKFNIICFSNGNFDGLGDARAHELQNSINLLLNNNGSSNYTKIYLFNHSDGMHENWDIVKMEAQLANILTDIDNSIILTFDHNGVSKHPNHIACYKTGYNYWLHNKRNTSLLTLNSYNSNILLKYSGFMWQIIKLIFNRWFKFIDMETLGKFYLHFSSKNDAGNQITFINSYSQYILAYATMLNAHKSQVVWFRFFWWWFSRFVFVNDLNIIQ